MISGLLGGRTLLIFEHGPFTSVDIPYIETYVKYWRDLYQDLELHTRGVPLVLAFEFSDEASTTHERTLGDSAFVQKLGAVSPREVASHLRTFKRFYNLSESEIAIVAQRLVEDCNGFFQPIHHKLEE